MPDKQDFNHELFRKVFYFEWALLIICGLAQALVLYCGKQDYTAPDLRVSLILLGLVGLLSPLTPVKGSYWDRFCFLLLELMLITGATLAGLARFLFPLFVVVVAKACLMLDRWGMLTISLCALVASLFWAAFKLYLQQPAILADGFTPRAVAYLLGGAFLAIYIAVVLFILVAVLTETQKAERRSRLEAERLSQEVEELATQVERSRIAREIHDSLGHTLTSLNIQLDIARKLGDREPSRAAEALNVAKDLAGQSLTDVRVAVQSLGHDRDFNFQDAVQVLVDDVRTRQPMTVQLEMNVEQVPVSVGYPLFRVIQECFTNVLKHASASEVHLRVAQSAELLELEFSDNGRGLEKNNQNGFGMQSMQQRVQNLHGTVSISGVPAEGTVIKVNIPLRLLDKSEPTVTE